jgi:hypothetical protein
MTDQAAKNLVVPAVHSNAGLVFIKALKGNRDLASIFSGFWGIEGRKLDLSDDNHFESSFLAWR